MGCTGCHAALQHPVFLSRTAFSAASVERCTPKADPQTLQESAHSVVAQATAIDILGPYLTLAGAGYAATQLHRTGYSSIAEHF